MLAKDINGIGILYGMDMVLPEGLCYDDANRKIQNFGNKSSITGKMPI